MIALVRVYQTERIALVTENGTIMQHFVDYFKHRPYSKLSVRSRLFYAVPAFSLYIVAPAQTSSLCSRCHGPLTDSTYRTCNNCRNDGRNRRAKRQRLDTSTNSLRPLLPSPSTSTSSIQNTNPLLSNLSTSTFSIQNTSPLLSNSSTSISDTVTGNESIVDSRNATNRNSLKIA